MIYKHKKTYTLMKLKLQRLYFKPEYTIGKLYLNDVYFCDTLEDTYRDLTKEPKVYGMTCIPFGTYKVVLSYSEKFKQVLPELVDVPLFKDIKIHAGNFPRDTDGCIIVGYNTIKGGVVNSKETIVKLIEKIKDSQEISITVYI